MTGDQPAAAVLVRENVSRPTAPPVRPRIAPFVLVGSYLRRLRRLKGRTQREAARVIGGTPSKINRMETGCHLRPEDVATLLRLYQVVDEGVLKAVERLLGMVRISPHLIYDAGQGRPDRLDALGDRATVERVFTATVIPPMLQTPEYAEACHRLTPTREPAGPRAAEARGFRRDTEVTVLLDELVLERPAGGAAVMAAQWAHVEDAVERGVARVLVASSRFLVPHPYVSELTIKDQPLCVWQHPGSVLYASGPKALAVSDALDAAYAAADPPARSLDRIGKARERFERIAAQAS